MKAKYDKGVVHTLVAVSEEAHSALDLARGGSLDSDLLLENVRDMISQVGEHLADGIASTKDDLFKAKCLLTVCSGLMVFWIRQIDGELCS